MKEKLTPKQKKFALEFLISGNITDAAKNAGYSERSARQIGSLNLTKPNVVEYMNEILDKTKSEEVATTEEVLEFLTSVMRGDVAEQFGLDPAITDRTKAAQLLMKRFNDDQRMNLKLTKLEMTEDGSIVINTKIRTDGIKAGTAEIEAGVHRAADRVNTLGSNVKKTLNNQIDSFVKLNDEYSTQKQKVESLY